MNIYKGLIIILFVIIILIFPFTNFVYSKSNITSNIMHAVPQGYNTNHPRLPHPTNTFLNKLRQNNTQLKVYTDIADAFDPANPLSADRIRKTVIAYLITSENTYLSKLKQLHASDFPNFGFIKLDCLALVYDWLYEYFDQSSRNLFADKMVALCEVWKNDYEINIQVSPYNDVGYNRLFASIIIGAIAVFPDHVNSQQYFEYARKVLFEYYLPVWQQTMEGGGWYEGIEYLSLGVGKVIYPALSSWKEATGEDLFLANSWLEELVYYPIYTTRPDDTPIRLGDVAWCGTITFPDQLALSIVYNNPYGIWWARYKKQYGPYEPSGYEPSGWLWCEPDDLSRLVKPPDDLPLQHYFKGWGVVVMRSDWTEDATYSVFRCGDSYWSHQHADIGHFTIYKRGALAIDSGTYSAGYKSEHHIGYQMQSIAHNVITVTDPNDYETKEFDTYNVGKIKLPNDGGQRRIGSSYTHAPKDKTEYENNIEDFEMGDILNYEATDNYVYIDADITSAYTNSKSGTGEWQHRTRRVKKFIRAFVYIRPDYFVVFDRISSYDKNFKKRWLLHSINEPQQDGNKVSIVRSENVEHTYTWATGLKYRSLDQKKYQYNGRLVWTILLPEQHDVIKIGGIGHEFEINGRNYIHKLNNYATPGIEVSTDPAIGPQEPGAWRVEVSPAMADTFDLFLNVLGVNTPSTGNASIQASLINNQDGDEIVGCYIEQANEANVIIFPKNYNQIKNIRYTIDDNKLVKHLICDMPKGFMYLVKIAGNIWTSGITSNNGTISFAYTQNRTTQFEILITRISGDIIPPAAPTGVKVTIPQ